MKANDEAVRKLEETRKILESKSELAERVKEAEALGFRPFQLTAIVEKACEVGARHGLGVKDSINRVVKDLEENWEPKLGFENEKTRLSIELDQVNEKIKLSEGKEKIPRETRGRPVYVYSVSSVGCKASVLLRSGVEDVVAIPFSSLGQVCRFEKGGF